MTDGPAASLPDLLSRLEIILSEPIDFAATDTASIAAKVRLLTAAAIYFAASSAANRLGGYRRHQRPLLP